MVAVNPGGDSHPLPHFKKGFNIMRKKKVYNTILKTYEEAENYIDRYTAEIEPTFPDILKQLPQKNDVEEKTKYIEIVSTELNRIIGTCNSTLTFASKHKEDGLCPLADNVTILNQLRTVLSKTKNMLQAVNRSAQYDRTSDIFASLAKGIIPPDSAAVTTEDEAELQEDTQTLD